MIMSKHNQQLQITKCKGQDPTKAHTDHYNGDFKIVIFSFSDSAY